MKENNLSQLVGALGGWLQARPYGAEQDALDRAARIVLDMRLLGVDIDDVNAPELDALSPQDRDVVEQARVWAQARREEARRRVVAEERIARQRRVAEREAAPNEAFAWPPVPRAEPTVTDGASAPEAVPSVVVDDEVATARQPDTGQPDTGQPDTGQPDTGQPDSDQPDTGHLEPVLPDFDQPASDVDAAGPTAVLADPSDHAFFADHDGDEIRSVERQAGDAAGVRRLRPDAVFKVVLVVWALAALGVLVVLLRIALG